MFRLELEFKPTTAPSFSLQKASGVCKQTSQEPKRCSPAPDSLSSYSSVYRNNGNVGCTVHMGLRAEPPAAPDAGLCAAGARGHRLCLCPRWPGCSWTGATHQPGGERQTRAAGSLAVPVPCLPPSHAVLSSAGAA